MSEIQLTIERESDISRVITQTRALVERGIVAGAVVLRIGRASKNRAQEAKYHALIADIAKIDQQHSVGAWKALLVDSFEHELIAQGSGLAHPSKIVISLDGQRAVTIRASTTKFRKKEASDFIEWLYAFGSGQGVAFSEKALEIYNEYKEMQ